MSAARAMVSRLSSAAAITTAMSVTEIADFQRQFTANRKLIFDELQIMTEGIGWKPAALALELRNKGLTVDGKYGTRTGTALMLAMWARSGDPQAINAIGNGLVPNNPAQFPQYYAANRNAYDNYLAPFQTDGPAASPPLPVIPTPTPVTPNIPAIENGGTSLPTEVGPLVFDDGSTVLGQGQGRMSFAMMMAITLGIGLVGGFTYVGLKRAKKLPRFLRGR